LLEGAKSILIFLIVIIQIFWRESTVANIPIIAIRREVESLKYWCRFIDLCNTQGHWVLLFKQTQQMLDIIENYVISTGFVYRRMDGSTPIKQRMSLIDEFNEGAHLFIFILTTKMGGLGTNLIGATRVVIFDPDWNPSTDIQVCHLCDIQIEEDGENCLSQVLCLAAVVVFTMEFECLWW
jgi:SNF2 family DNA or RNA helicase